MKIALIAPYFPPNIGGIETYIYELARRLSKQHKVEVFTCGRGVIERYNGVKVFRLRAIDLQNIPFRPRIPYPIPASLMFKLVESDVDLIHAHGHAFITSFQAALAARLTNKPFVLTIHDIGIAYKDYALIRGVRPMVDSTMVKFILKQADQVIAQNEATLNYTLKFKPRQTTMIRQAVDLKAFEPKEEGEYITFIAARLVPQKGGEVFVRAIPRVIKEFGEAKFMVIGDGFQKNYLERLATDLGVKDYIEFVGAIPYKDVPEYLGLSKIVVFPSKVPTGLALLEVAAMKRAIITTKNTWAVNSLNDAPVYVSLRNPEETAKAIVYLLRNPDERNKVAERVYKMVATKHSWETVVSRHLELYSDLVGKRANVSSYMQKTLKRRNSTRYKSRR